MIFFLQLLAQIPQGVPHPDDNEPLVLTTPFDYILYVGIPILILIGAMFLWRRKKKREKERKEEK
ncbi:LPXTG cell wall anchor domain-containing protein [Marivirga sp.]|uniref:LPXTG cell wall anchor domain-containing protein n=1 Tax=Marivirga sp. TaxID=2018662 RepID=UPI002D7F6522|nr:LPXTG cell wall anchor domain-containing protein [Marivirga sp.]HET8860413.1 LPXTG cell wall anchor domain-containing protein [Marivirga sp.]